jgi:hypothetical protein
MGFYSRIIKYYQGGVIEKAPKFGAFLHTLQTT